MNNYCSNCGAKLREQSVFCSNCGLSTEEQANAPQQNPAPVVPVQQQNIYNQDGIYQKPKTALKFNYIFFILVTSLIILLHFISRTLNMMTSILTWNYSFGPVFMIMITLAVFIIAITHFAAAVNSFYKQNPIKKRANSARKLSALSVAIAILSTVLIFTDYCVILGIYLPLYEGVSGYYNGIPTNTFMYQFVPILIYDIFFVIFAFINMSKSSRFKAEINNKLYEQS